MNLLIETDYRPKLHFTPPAMWMNDPNGMVYVDGTYHLFYQHYPEKPVWGPMYWGHAVSTDLLNWKHLPIALSPDKLGYVFSGSCVYDGSNLSGFGAKGKMPLIAIYTSHDPETHRECQSLAYSTDYVHFETYSQNPVIPNPGIRDFRDPKVFWNPMRDCFSLVLAASDRVSFYASLDLKKWERTGDFVTGRNGAAGICECPDCFPVETEDGIKWVLIISMIMQETQSRKNLHRTQYFIGTFDGDTFVETEPAPEPLWLNHGPDHYAGVTFQNMEKPVLMAWANNWSYAGETPTGGGPEIEVAGGAYRGQMTFPTEVVLKKTAAGYRAALVPVGLEPFRERRIAISGQMELSSQSFGLEIEGAQWALPVSVTLSNGFGERLVIEVTAGEIIVDRTGAGECGFSKRFTMPEFAKVRARRYETGGCRLEILFDVSILEIFAEGGLVPIAMSVYPKCPFERIWVDGRAQTYLYLL